MHPLEELFWRFGPLSRIGTTINALICSAGFVSWFLTGADVQHLIPLIGLEIVFVALAVLAWAGLIPRAKAPWERELEQELEESSLEQDEPTR